MRASKKHSKYVNTQSGVLGLGRQYSGNAKLSDLKLWGPRFSLKHHHDSRVEQDFDKKSSFSVILPISCYWNSVSAQSHTWWTFFLGLEPGRRNREINRSKGTTPWFHYFWSFPGSCWGLGPRSFKLGNCAPYQVNHLLSAHLWVFFFNISYFILKFHFILMKAREIQRERYLYCSVLAYGRDRDWTWEYETSGTKVFCITLTLSPQSCKFFFKLVQKENNNWAGKGPSFSQGRVEVLTLQ